MPRTKSPASKPRSAPRKPRKAKPEPGSRGLSPQELAETAEPRAQALADAIHGDGGVVLAVYKEPLGGHEVVFAGLPIGKVEPTPYQRDVSEAHVKRLTSAFERVGRYLDPIVAVRHDGRYWTPNGSHRLTTARGLGMRSIVALVMPEEEVAFQILALNTEKAHNLKERSLE
ncbi:MAG: ParB N-terminal domain-containing protein, partial [Deltaproteobacteria bacterium]|nr:ParB N-terminal domain-containing protein [Deltaproteobacteria bacterium]